VNRDLWCHPLALIGLSLIVLAADYLSGPEIHFPIAFAIPVLLASRHDRKPWGIAIAVVLPAFRIGFDLSWGVPVGLREIAANYLIRVVALAGLALLVDHVTALSREVKVLRGILPICSSCRRIRLTNGSWEQLEAYIVEHSDAEFSHGICSECFTRLYPQYGRQK
jgi:hypothetical protein